MMDELKKRLLQDPRAALDEGEGVVERLWDISSDANETKTLRKAAKKALYILGSKGVDISRKKPKKEKKILPPQVHIAGNPLLSVPDSEGSSRLIIPVEDDRGLAFTEYRFILGSQDGVLQFSSVPGSKTHLHKLLETRENGFFPVTQEYALFRLDRALQKTEVEHISGLESIPDILRAKHQDVPDHPVLSVVTPGLTRIFSPEEEKRIFSLEEVARLSLPERDIEEVRARIQEAQSSRLIIDNKRPEERFEQIIDGFFKTYFTEERCSLYRTLLLDIAYFLQYHDFDIEARILVNTAKDFRPGIVAEKRNPVANYLVYQALIAR